MEAKSHWEAIYQQKRPMDVSWYAPHLDVSLRLLAKAGLSRDSQVIDVGGGASTLVDDLLERGIGHLTVLDISGRALTVSKTRLGDRATMVHWIEADITEATLPSHSYDLWHDRALFHFLTTVDQRFRYLKTMRDALTPLGRVILATFSLQGPPRCSGLEVARYSPETLQRELPELKLVETRRGRTPNPVSHGAGVHLLLFPESVIGSASEIDQHEMAAYNRLMRLLRVTMSTQGCSTGLSVALLALMLASPGPCLVSQFSRALHRQGALPEATASAHPRIDRLHTASARADSSCHAHYEDRSTMSHSLSPFPKPPLAAVPPQADNGAHGSATTAQLSSLTVAGPAPPLRSRFLSLAPPLTRSRV